MSTLTLTIKDQQQSRQLRIQRMTVYKQSKIIEAIDDREQKYYLFFHNDHYLNYVTAKKLTKSSHLKTARNQGVTLSAPHPLIQSVILSYHSFKKQSFNDLFQKLQQQYTLQETALIASYFEPFIKKSKLENLIKTLFYKERRDGKLLSCYRILLVLKDFAPTHSLVEAFAGDLQFKQYDERYKQEDQQLLAKDSIYVEKQLYDSKHHNRSFQELTSLYQAQSRWSDLICIYIPRVLSTKEQEDYHTLRTLMREQINSDDNSVFLEDLYNRGLELESLRHDLLDTYIEQGKLKEAVGVISKHEMTLEPTQSDRFIEVIKEKDIKSLSLPPNELQDLMKILFDSEDTQAIDLLHEAVSSLLDERSSSFIQEWAEPLRTFPPAAPILQKVDEMALISEDPNKQMRLGELYHYFEHPEEAIECMSWDMELRDEDPQPVHWLAKLYNELGMNEEHKAYQQLYIDMVKRS